MLPLSFIKSYVSSLNLLSQPVNIIECDAADLEQKLDGAKHTYTVLSTDQYEAFKGNTLVQAFYMKLFHDITRRQFLTIYAVRDGLEFIVIAVAEVPKITDVPF